MKGVIGTAFWFLRVKLRHFIIQCQKPEKTVWRTDRIL